MDLKQLRALLAIAETGSVTKAADILHIVQPALSRQVKLLEDELGAVLFTRERFGMVLTDPGRIFVEHARRALQELDRGREQVGPKSQNVSGSVSVGFLPSAAEHLVSDLMSRIKQDFPLVTLRSTVSYVLDLEALLTQGEVDVALLHPRFDSGFSYPSEPLLEESLYLVGPTDSGIALDTPVPIEQLNALPLILPPLPHGIRLLMERECAAAGVRLNVAAETNSMAVQKSSVAQGLGFAILSGLVVYDAVAQGVLTAAPISGANLLRTLNLAWATGKEPSLATKKVMLELRRIVKQRVEEDRWPGAVLLESAGPTERRVAV